MKTEISHFEISPSSAEFAVHVIDGLSCGDWETWKEEGSIPQDEPLPRIEVYHPGLHDWIDLQGSPALGGTFRIVLGPNGAREIIEAVQILKDQKNAAREDGPAALARHARLLRGATALVKKLEAFAAV